MYLELLPDDYTTGLYSYLAVYPLSLWAILFSCRNALQPTYLKYVIAFVWLWCYIVLFLDFLPMWLQCSYIDFYYQNVLNWKLCFRVSTEYFCVILWSGWNSFRVTNHIFTCSRGFLMDLCKVHLWVISVSPTFYNLFVISDIHVFCWYFVE